MGTSASTETQSSTINVSDLLQALTRSNGDDDAPHEVDDLNVDFKTQSLQGWPDGFLQVTNPPTIVVPPDSKTLYVRVHTQKVGNGLQIRSRNNIQLLNDPDPERKWQLGLHDVKIVVEWNLYHEILRNNGKYQWRVDRDICDDELTLKEYPKENDGSWGSMNKLSRKAMHMFAQKYVAKP